MKKVFLAALALLTTVVSSSANEVIKITTGEWAPYTIENSKSGGVLQKIVNEALKLENVDVKYEFHSWEKAYSLAKEVEADATIPWFKTKDREKDFLYSKNAILRTKTVFFHLKSLDFKWQKYEDLKNYRVGETSGFKTEKLLREKGIDVEMAISEKENFQKLLDGKIDVTSSSYLVGYNIIKNTFTAEESAKFTNDSKKVYPATGVYFLVSKKHPKAQELINKFDAGLKKLIRSGRYIKLIKEAI